MALRAGRGGAGTGRHLAQDRPRILLERRLAQLDVHSRPLMAGFDIVGRRLDLHRRTDPAGRRIPAPPWSASEVCRLGPKRHTTRPPGALTGAVAHATYARAMAECWWRGASATTILWQALRSAGRAELGSPLGFAGLPS